MARNQTPNEKSFLRDVKDHVMEIRRDDGPYRNLRFQKPGTVNLYFDITTWPGFLCISGDMGCYVFSRLPDMFEFFRGQKPHIRGDKRIGINLGYWHEKVQAECRHSPCEEYDSAEFKRVVNRVIYSGGWPKPVRDDVKEEVLALADDGEFVAKDAAYRFSIRHNGRTYDFQDFWEYGDCKRYSYHFVWSCYAVAWAVQMYDGRENKELP